MDLDTVIHLATSLLMLVFGIGAWAEKRKSGESTNAGAIDKLTSTVNELKTDVGNKVAWKDMDRAIAAERRATDLQFENLCERVERVEKKVFNGTGVHHRG